MSDLVMPFEQLLSAASEFSNQAGELEAILGKIQGQLETLSGAFRGRTAERFQTLMAEWTKDMGNIQEVLTQVGQGLNKTVADFQEYDESASKRF